MNLLVPSRFSGRGYIKSDLSVCLCGFTQGTLYTTTTVYGVLVHQEGAICTTKAQYAPWCTRETIFFEKVRGPWWLCVCVCGFTQATLCTTTMVYGVLGPPSRNVHHGAQGRLYFLKKLSVIRGAFTGNSTDAVDRLLSRNPLCLLGSGRPADCKSFHSNGFHSIVNISYIISLFCRWQVF